MSNELNHYQQQIEILEKSNAYCNQQINANPEAWVKKEYGVVIEENQKQIDRLQHYINCKTL